MLGKLMKYDLRFMLRTFAPIWILAPVVSLLFGFSIGGVLSYLTGYIFDSGNQDKSNLIILIISIIFFSVMVAMAVMTILFVVQRFWNGLLKEEGYLMFTLPVDTWELITAKGLCATIATFISCLVAVLSCIILWVAAIPPYERQEVGHLIMRNLLDPETKSIIVLFLSLLMMVFEIAAAIYRIYAAMAVGQLFSRHQVLWSCVSYVGLSIAWTAVERLFNFVSSLLSLNFDSVIGMMVRIHDETDFYCFVAFTILFSVIQIVGFHIIAERILSKKLNLE